MAPGEGDPGEESFRRIREAGQDALVRDSGIGWGTQIKWRTGRVNTIDTLPGICSNCVRVAEARRTGRVAAMFCLKISLPPKQLLSLSLPDARMGLR